MDYIGSIKAFDFMDYRLYLSCWRRELYLTFLRTKTCWDFLYTDPYIEHVVPPSNTPLIVYIQAKFYMYLVNYDCHMQPIDYQSKKRLLSKATF